MCGGGIVGGPITAFPVIVGAMLAGKADICVAGIRAAAVELFLGAAFAKVASSNCQLLMSLLEQAAFLIFSNAWLMATAFSKSMSTSSFFRVNTFVEFLKSVI